MTHRAFASGSTIALEAISWIPVPSNWPIQVLGAGAGAVRPAHWAADARDAKWDPPGSPRTSEREEGSRREPGEHVKPATSWPVNRVGADDLTQPAVCTDDAGLRPWVLRRFRPGRSAPPVLAAVRPSPSERWVR